MELVFLLKTHLSFPGSVSYCPFPSFVPFSTARDKLGWWALELFGLPVSRKFGSQFERGG
jgi:hypothetical protein